MILVTGATGTVGRELVQELLKRQANFRVAARETAKVTEILGPAINSVPLDFDDEASLRRAFESADKLFLLTPHTPHAGEQARRAIDVACEVGVKHIVRQSVSGADTHPAYQIGRAHRETELYLLASGVAGTVLRPAYFMSNFLAMKDTIRDGKLYMPLGNVPIATMAPRDIAAVAAVTLTEEGYENQSFDLTGPENVTGTQIAEAFSHALGRAVEYVPISDDDFRKAMAGASEWLVESYVNLFQYMRGGPPPVNNNVEKITGRGAQDIRAWALEHMEALLS